MNQNEKKLIQALHRGDRYACNELVAQFSGQIYNVALRLTGHPEEAEEVLQETFINACKAAENFEARSSLGTWLYRIATNNGLMRLRRKETPTVPLDASSQEDGPDVQPQLLQDWHWNPESMTLSDELHRVMDQAVDSLPDPLRAVFVLRDLEGLSTKETAEVLNLSPGNVKVRLHRARFLLREQLAAYFDEQAEAVE